MDNEEEANELVTLFFSATLNSMVVNRPRIMLPIPDCGCTLYTITVLFNTFFSFASMLCNQSVSSCCWRFILTLFVSLCTGTLGCSVESSIPSIGVIVFAISFMSLSTAVVALSYVTEKKLGNRVPDGEGVGVLYSSRVGSIVGDGGCTTTLEGVG